MLGDGAGDHGVDRLRVGHVEMDEGRPATGLLDQTYRLAATRVIDVGDDDHGTLTSGEHRRGASDSPRTAGDERDRVVEPTGHQSLSSTTIS